MQTKDSAADYAAGFTNVLATENKKETPEEVMDPSMFFSSVLQDSASVKGALDSKIVAATVRKIAKLSSEAGGSGNLKIVGDFHMPLLLLQKVTDMYNENCVAVILVLIIVGLT